MDVKITDGDIELLPDGAYMPISGLDEAIQHVRMAVLTNRGSFRYDRSFGLDFDAFSPEADDPAAQLDMLVKEAAADVGGVETEVLSYDAQTSTAQIKVSYRGSSAVTEVDFSGNI